MRKSVIALVVLVTAIMISSLRMRCSSTSMQLCRRARSTVGISMQQQQHQLHNRVYAALLSSNRSVPLMLTPTLPLLASRQLSTTAAAAGSGEGSESSSSSPKPATPTVLQAARQLITTAARTLLALLLLIAAAPYVLSSKWGTNAACRIASRALPGDVHVQRVRLGWSQPLALEGLVMHEGAAGSSRQLLSVERMSTAGAAVEHSLP
jgi:hypothetical protein